MTKTTDIRYIARPTDNGDMVVRAEQDHRSPNGRMVTLVARRQFDVYIAEVTSRHYTLDAGGSYATPEAAIDAARVAADAMHPAAS